LETRKERIVTGMEEESGERSGPGGIRGEGNFTPIRTGKSIVMRNDDSLSLDPGVISPALYNNFHYSLIPRTEKRSNLAIGVTSTRTGDGKTTVAANLAVSIALADEREAVLVDLNFRSPRLHSVFGLEIGPGLAEALAAPMVHVARTTVRHLHVMTLGHPGATYSGLRSPSGGEPGTNGKKNGKSNGHGDPGNLMTMPSFKHVMHSLKQRFEIIIFDMPSVSDPILPLNLMRQMDGIVLVVDATRTTKDDITKASQQVGKERMLGMVLNRVAEAS
jgi:non-specific protein-tyrosine kinase